jgi:1-acyl-sn-glycerol-3-phosphate acyltransferase
MHPDSLSEELIGDENSAGLTRASGVGSGAGEALPSARAESSTEASRRSLMGRAHYCWSLFVAAMLLLILGPPILTVSYLRRHWVYPVARFGARAWLLFSGARVRVRGRENLVPRQSYIFIANHRSFLDTAALFLHAGEGRRIGLLAKKELLKVPILGYGMGYVNIMAIDRSNRERAIETVRAATERIKSGISYGVFAEGTRARPGELLPFKKGAFYMALDAGVPIVPVAIKNTDVLMGKGTGVARSGTMEMVFLPPVATDRLIVEDDDKDEVVKQLVERIHRSVAEELKR